LTYRIVCCCFSEQATGFGSRFPWALREEALTVSSGDRLGNGAASP
jgi:hypothetical protein